LKRAWYASYTTKCIFTDIVLDREEKVEGRIRHLSSKMAASLIGLRRMRGVFATGHLVLRAQCRNVESGTGIPGVLVTIPEIKSFIERSMVAVGTKPEHGKALADNLTMADYRGHFSHGLNRLGEYTEISNRALLRVFSNLYLPIFDALTYIL